MVVDEAEAEAVRGYVATARAAAPVMFTLGAVMIVTSVLVWRRRHRFPLSSRFPVPLAILNLFQCLLFHSEVVYSLIGLLSFPCGIDFLLIFPLLSGLIATYVVRGWLLLFRYKLTEEMLRPAPEHSVVLSASSSAAAAHAYANPRSPIAGGGGGSSGSPYLLSSGRTAQAQQRGGGGSRRKSARSSLRLWMPPPAAGTIAAAASPHHGKSYRSPHSAASPVISVKRGKGHSRGGSATSDNNHSSNNDFGGGGGGWWSRHRYMEEAPFLLKMALPVPLMEVALNLVAQFDLRFTDLCATDNLPLLAELIRTVSFLLIVGQGVALLVILRKLRGFSLDGFGLKLEFQMASFAFTCGVGTTAVLSAVAPTIVTAIRLWVIAGLQWAVFFPCTVWPLLWSYRYERRLATEADAVEAADQLEPLLALPQGYAAFLAFSSAEFSAENCLFYKAAGQLCAEVEALVEHLKMLQAGGGGRTPFFLLPPAVAAAHQQQQQQRRPLPAAPHSPPVSAAAVSPPTSPLGAAANATGRRPPSLDANVSAVAAAVVALGGTGTILSHIVSLTPAAAAAAASVGGGNVAASGSTGLGTPKQQAAGRGRAGSLGVAGAGAGAPLSPELGRTGVVPLAVLSKARSLVRTATAMYNRYVVEDAPREVNLPHTTRTRILSALTAIRHRFLSRELASRAAAAAAARSSRLTATTTAAAAFAAATNTNTTVATPATGGSGPTSADGKTPLLAVTVVGSDSNGSNGSGSDETATASLLPGALNGPSSPDPSISPSPGGVSASGRAMMTTANGGGVERRRGGSATWGSSSPFLGTSTAPLSPQPTVRSPGGGGSGGPRTVRPPPVAPSPLSGATAITPSELVSSLSELCEAYREGRREILHLMQTNAFVRFRASDAFRTLVEQLRLQGVAAFQQQQQQAGARAEGEEEEDDDEDEGEGEGSEDHLPVAPAPAPAPVDHMV